MASPMIPADGGDGRSEVSGVSTSTARLRLRLKSRLLGSDGGGATTPQTTLEGNSSVAEAPNATSAGPVPPSPVPVFRRKRSMKFDTPTSETKRSRGTTPDDIVAKQEGVSNSDEITVDTELDFDEQLFERKQCCGCFRVSGVDKSYYVGGSEFRWLYDDGRGDWCKDCYQTHRLYYGKMMTLPLFGRWLKTHRREFLSVLMAVVSIKNEGVCHITKAAVDARVALLRHAFALAGVPFPLCAIADPADPNFDAAAATFVPLIGEKTSGEFGAMALVPLPMPATGPPVDQTARFVTKAQLQLWPMMPMAMAGPGFVQMWNKLGSATAPEVPADLGEKESPAAMSVDEEAPVSKAEAALRVTYDGLKTAAVVLLTELNTEEARTRERDFTPILGKLLRFKQDVVESPVVNRPPSSSAGVTTCNGGADLLASTESLIAAVSGAKKMMRSFKEYRKHQKVQHLMASLPHLRCVAEFLEKDGQTLGPWVGSALAKGVFLEAAADDPLAALKEFTPARFAYDSGAAHDPTIRPGEIVVDCLTSKIYDKLKQAVHTGCEDQGAWLELKQNLSSMSKGFQQFIVERAPALDIDQNAQRVFEAFNTVCKAALKDEGVGPAELKHALSVIEENTYGKRIHEAMKNGIGLALKVDAKEVLAEGELDMQALADIVRAGENIFGTGVEEDEGCITISENSCVIDPCSDDLVRILVDALRNLESGCQHMSTKAMSEESATLSELIALLAKVIVLHDTFRLNSVFYTLAQRWSEWESAFGSLDGTAWPPQVGGLPRTNHLENEAGLLKFAEDVASFCQRGMAKPCKLSKAVQEARDSLAEAGERLKLNIAVRSQVVRESQVVAALLGEQWHGGATGTHRMLADLSNNKSGFFSKIIEVAAMRKLSQGVEYITVSEIGIGGEVKVTVGGVPDPELAVFSNPGEVDDFFQQRLHGTGIELVLHSFLHTQLPCIVDNFMVEVSQLLDHIVKEEAGAKPPDAGDARVIDSLGHILNMEQAAELSKKFPLDWTVTYPDGPEDLASILNLPGNSVLKSCAELVDICSQQAVVSGATTDARPVRLCDLMPALEVYGAVANMLSVASIVSFQAFGEKSQAIVWSTEKDVVSVRVAPLLAQFLDWMSKACGLNWRARSTESCGFDGHLKYTFVAMDRVVIALASSWLPAAQKAGVANSERTLATLTRELKEKTPQYSHIVSNNRYNPTLAKKQLLKAPVARVSVLIDQVTMLREDIICRFKMTEKAACESPCMEEADGVVEAARAAMYVIAAVTALENFSHSEKGAKMAGELLADKKCVLVLPDALKSKLKAMTKTT